VGSVGNCFVVGGSPLAEVQNPQADFENQWVAEGCIGQQSRSVGTSTV